MEQTRYGLDSGRLSRWGQRSDRNRAATRACATARHPTVRIGWLVPISRD